MCKMLPAKGMWYCMTHRILASGLCPAFLEVVDTLRKRAVK